MSAQATETPTARRWSGGAAAIVVLVVALAPVGSSLASAPAGAAEAAESTESVAPDRSAATGQEVILYYFHGKRRCNTCRTIEAYAKQAIEGRYGPQLASGTLKWKVVNTDEPANRHFTEDFNLISSSLVLASMDGGEVQRFEVLQEAWTLVRDELRFVQYIQRSVHEFLK